MYVGALTLDVLLGDIRSLKQTLGMHSLVSKTPDMVAKELLLAIAGYNLVRSIQMAAARQAKLTMDEVLKENKRLEVDLAGLKA